MSHFNFIEGKIFNRKTINQALLSTGYHFDELIDKTESIIMDANKLFATLSIHLNRLDTYKFTTSGQELISDIKNRLNDIYNIQDRMSFDWINDTKAAYLDELRKSEEFLQNLLEHLQNPESLHPIKGVYDMIEFIQLSKQETGYSKTLTTTYEKLSVMLVKY